MKFIKKRRVEIGNNPFLIGLTYQTHTVTTQQPNYHQKHTPNIRIHHSLHTVIHDRSSKHTLRSQNHTDMKKKAFSKSTRISLRKINKRLQIEQEHPEMRKRVAY